MNKRVKIVLFSALLSGVICSGCKEKQHLQKMTESPPKSHPTKEIILPELKSETSEEGKRLWNLPLLVNATKENRRVNMSWFLAHPEFIPISWYLERSCKNGYRGRSLL